LFFSERSILTHRFSARAASAFAPQPRSGAFQAVGGNITRIRASTVEAWRAVELDVEIWRHQRCACGIPNRATIPVNDYEHRLPGGNFQTQK